MLLRIGDPDTSTTELERFSDYPHTRLLLNKAIAHAREHYHSYFFTILNQVSLRIIADHPDENIEPQPGSGISNSVDEFLKKPFNVDLKSFSESLRQDQDLGHLCIAIELANALEDCIANPARKEEYGIWVQGKQDPILAFKAHILIAFFHELVRSMVFQTFSQYFKPPAAEDDPDPQALSDKDHPANSGYRWEDMFMRGTVLLAVDGNDSLDLDLKAVVRMCFESSNFSEPEAEGNCFDLDNKYLARFVNSVETCQYIYAFPVFDEAKPAPRNHEGRKLQLVCLRGAKRVHWETRVTSWSRPVNRGSCIIVPGSRVKAC
ncbi:hypothetical protein VKT23_006032 [Stygiomarasmius scandens]|uniref:Uncharacterized protein n=1 Tax=Marasmiellus scandens TaxID=2682957 RepID=A0ABR1JR38_9AGAR